MTVPPFMAPKVKKIVKVEKRSSLEHEKASIVEWLLRATHPTPSLSKMSTLSSGEVILTQDLSSCASATSTVKEHPPPINQDKTDLELKRLGVWSLRHPPQDPSGPSRKGSDNRT